MNFLEPLRPSHDAIARRAYEIFLERGALAGDPIEDWLRAEAELIAHAIASPTPPPDVRAPSTLRKARSTRKPAPSASLPSATTSRPRTLKIAPLGQSEPSATPRQRSSSNRSRSKRA